MREFKPPQTPPHDSSRLSIFLGGSIEMGAAEDWQKKLISWLAALPYAAHIDIYNPRRDDWNAAWPNDYSFAPFREQVDWEILRQKEAGMIVYYFAGNTISPITLFELGLFRDRAPVIGADASYKRLGNLLVTRDHFANMDVNVGWAEFTGALRERLDAAARARGWLPQGLCLQSLDF